MKKLQKILGLALVLALALSLAACGGNDAAASGDSKDADNAAPAIAGVADTSVEAGHEFDALDGISASDPEDGDLSAQITIDSMPALDFQNGKATPATAGDYELTYTVTDKGGLTATAYATLTVTRATAEPELLVSYDFAQEAEVDAHGWELRVNEGAEGEAAFKQGAAVFEITNPGEGDGAVQMVKPGFALEKADYRVKIWAKSTAPTYAHLLVRDENAEEWSTFGAVFNARIEEEIAPIEVFFTSEGEGSAELILNLGKISPNPDNPEDTTPENFTVTIDKVELYKITGEETETPVYTADFATGEGLTVEAGDGAAAEASFADGAAVAAITAYPAEGGGVWSIKANLGLGEATVEEGAKYYYRFTVNSSNGTNAECLVESGSQYDKVRANFNGIELPAGEDKEIFHTFTAENGVEDPVIRLQIGNAPEGVTENTLTFSNLEFGKLEGDKEVEKTIETFSTIGKGTELKDSGAFLWETFNGTDEDNDRGVGTIYLQDGSLFYRIDNGGSVDWHNKLICPVSLPSDCYFTVEITAKASKPVSCGFFLNPAGGWDPRISEGIDFTTEEQKFTFNTTDTFITDMDVEALGEVTIEFTNVSIYKMPLM